MAQEQITVNTTTVQNILRKLRILEEESKILIAETDKIIENAELEGWSDSRYHTFKDQFFDTKGLFNSAIRRIEEEHIPFLKKIMRSAEDF